MPVSQLTERLRDVENESMAKIAELEKQLSQARKELETLRVSLGACTGRGAVLALKNRTYGAPRLCIAIHPGKKIGNLCQTCWSILIPSPGIIGALQRVDPHGRIQGPL